MAKKTIRLSEKNFQKKLNEAVVKSVRKILKEGFANRDMDEKWIDAERQIGSENMLQEVYNYFSGDQLRDFLMSLDNDYDLELFEDETYDDEEMMYEMLTPNQVRQGNSSPWKYYGSKIVGGLGGKDEKGRTYADRTDNRFQITKQSQANFLKQNQQ